MSGQPVKTQSEKNKKRNEYMESLALQESINDMNLQANKTYLLSGQLPPQSQMQDTRTTSEKLKDVELMKQKIAGDFAGIIDTSSVYALINMVMSSPLNLNNSLFRFFAQRASSIAEQYRNLYSVGIEGDQNDISRIFEYIKNMYSDTQGKFQSTKSYMNSQSSGSSSKVIGANDLDSVILQLDDCIKNLQFTSQRLANKSSYDNLQDLEHLKEKLQELKGTIPSNEQIQFMMYEFNQISDSIDVKKRKSYEEYFSLLEKLPKYNEVIALVNKISQYISSNNLRVANDGIQKLINMFGILYEPKTQYVYRDFYDEYKKPLDISEIDKLLMDESRQRQTIREEEERMKAQPVRVVNIDDLSSSGTRTRASSIASIDEGEITRQGMLKLMEQPEAEEKHPEQQIENNVFDILQNSKSIRDDLRDLLSNLSDDELIQLHNGLADLTGKPKSDMTNLAKHVKSYYVTSDIIGAYSTGFYTPETKIGIKGFGLKKKRVGRPRGTGMPKPERVIIPNFVGFGINEINQKQLKNGIVKIRRNTKTSFNDMPSKRVSSNLQGILKTISGGGIPNYNDLGKLDEEEKNYLNKLISRSNLTDRISVPAPSKDQQEKDIHNFEVMRGQIMSGNDSQELVKKFKLLIRKLSKQGLLPKADVEELLDILVDLNY
jgi:hypothetical protein